MCVAEFFSIPCVKSSSLSSSFSVFLVLGSMFFDLDFFGLLPVWSNFSALNKVFEFNRNWTCICIALIPVYWLLKALYNTYYIHIDPFTHTFIQ